MKAPRPVTRKPQAPSPKPQAMRILIIDNYDSFSYNLFQYFGELAGPRGEVIVKRNDEISVAEIRALRPAALVISPGPGTPDDAGISLAAIRELHEEMPILGVCLGHQALGQVFGGTVRRAPLPVHGKSAQVRHDGDPLFAGLKNPFEAARYHSLVVAAKGFPRSLKVIAKTGDGLVMAARHRNFPVWGVQFHPESILTPEGKKIIRNFLALAEKKIQPPRRQDAKKKSETKAVQPGKPSQSSGISIRKKRQSSPWRLGVLAVKSSEQS